VIDGAETGTRPLVRRAKGLTPGAIGTLYSPGLTSLEIRRFREKFRVRTR
jgi:hypothetical protein